MSKEYILIPYRSVGDFIFGESRTKILSVAGKVRTSTMYGFPVEDRYLDDFGYFHTLCSAKGVLEAVELFPDISTEELYLIIDGIKVLLSKEPDALIGNISKITDDLHWVDDEDGYSSTKLGIKIYCPDDIVEDVIIHDEHCYDEENEYIEENNL